MAVFTVLAQKLSTKYGLAAKRPVEVEDNIKCSSSYQFI